MMTNYKPSRKLNPLFDVKYSVLILFIAVLCLCASCNKFLDGEPISEVPADKMWKNPRDVEAGVNEIYSSFRDAMRTNIFEWGELRSDNYVLTTESASDRGKLIANQLTNDLACTSWASLYKVISNANFAIQNIPGSSIPNVDAKNDFIAQAYAMRALSYFYAVRVWGAVPVYLEPIDNLEKGVFKDRTPMKVVLKDVIMADLKRAEALISPTNLERKRISRAAIYAIEADVSMWLEDYDAADKLVDKIKTLSSFTAFQPSMETMKNTFVIDLNKKISDNDPLRDEYGPGFNELILVIHFDLDESPAYSMIYNLFSSGVLISPKLTSIFTSLATATPRDIRFDNYIRPATVAGTYKMHKYVRNGADISFSALAQCEMAYPVYRFTDLLLMQAEAKARLDKFQDALNILSSTVRTRAGVSTKTRTANTFASRDDLIDYILDERQIELIGEGKRWFDLVRTKRAIRVMGPINGMDNERQTLFPINYMHINQNPNIIQNDGY